MAKVILESGKEKKIRNFYPNVFKDEIQDILGNVSNGDIVEVCTTDGELVAKGYVAEATNAFVRVLTTKDIAVDKTLILEKIKRAYEKRKHLLAETNCVRAFYSEADGIPGLIIDKFDKYVSVQFRNSGLEVAFRQEIINAIKKVMKPKGIYERSDVENRTHEGVEQQTGIIYGEIPERIVMEDNGLKYYVDIIDGQKTGFFLDQRDSRKFIRPFLNENTRFLDVFSSSGGFSVAALKEGCKKVIAIDKEPHALELCKENYELNEFTNDFETAEGDAFLMLKILANRGEKFDVITLDPPSLIKKKIDIHRGRDMFFSLCDESFKLIEDGGIVGIITCAYHMSLQDLIEVTRMAASKNGKLLQVIGVNYQPEDHPWILHVPETLYLKALWVRVVNN
ncbi:class I SAM-dependent rRNA methyltransferase [Cetobacterium somerae]|jgi:23S rRNA (cytosine1962-C5)-methyltransferase|uniref:class I SAM-dependent rRNA methyltransferase n=1 Tax=Cetobacterium TaxID=180162 RepID=UPI00163D14DD|nr:MULTISPECIES: class I SAM-dependent rRNA methyltransferase [Cetobacterium]MBC2853944.1 class I SAM-dependent rRNA methyltransferase [Cetobacterium sp. 2G large]WVJ00400.1 class I SAM-dependent rRNA methyltransferase [Cetobacterium somerae]